jgi:hypothetical protein
MKVTLTDILLVALLVLLILERSCKKEIPVQKQPDIIVNVFDTVRHEVEVVNPLVIHEVQQPMPVSIDTSSIISDYFKKREYFETKTDSILESNFKFEVYNNKLAYFKHDYKLMKPLTTIIDHPAIIKYPGGLFLESFGGAKSIGAGITYVDKGRMYGIGYDAINQSAQVRVGFKLW